MRLMASLLTLALVCAPGVAVADSFSEALAAALANNADAEDARLAVEAARFDRDQARSGYLPTVTLSGSYGAQEVETRAPELADPVRSDFNPSTVSVDVTQRLYTGGLRRGQTRIARAGVDGAGYALRAAEQDVLLGAVQAYLGVYSAEQILRVRREQVEGLEHELNGTQRRLDVGEISRTDLLQVQARLAGARASFAQAVADLESARANYQAVVGNTPDEDLSPPSLLDAAPIASFDAVERAETGHPIVLQARAAVEAARGRVTVERAASLPQVNLVGGYDRAEDDQYAEREREEASAQLRLSMPLYDGGEARARTRQGLVNVRRAEARLLGVRREAIARATTAWSEREAARVVSATARDQERASAEAHAGAERERGLGLRTTIEVLNALQEWRDAQIAVVRAESQEVYAVYALLAAMGDLSLETLPEHAAQP